LTVRDTPNNIELIEALIASLDKDRAEVLIDVSLYEVTRNDLLQLGNQIATQSATGNKGNPTASLLNLGGIGTGALARSAPAAAILGPIGLAIALPTSQLQALQTKNRTRQLASTQIHVLDGEQHTIRIGQRVPI